MNQRLKIFLWAAVHHPDFRHCYITIPIWFDALKLHHRGQMNWMLTLGFRRPVVYIPWKVESAYLKAIGKTPEFDDIPF